MTKLNVKIAILVGCLLAFASTTHAQVHARYNFIDFTQLPQGLKKMKITPLAPFGIYGTNIVTTDGYQRTVNASGSVTVSNMLTDVNYKVEFVGKSGSTFFTNYFPTNVSGLVSASAYITSSTNLSGAVGAYSQDQANALFVSKSGGRMTGPLTNNSGFVGDISGTTNSLKVSLYQSSSGKTFWLPSPNEAVRAAMEDDIVTITSGIYTISNHFNLPQGSTFVICAGVILTNRLTLSSNLATIATGAPMIIPNNRTRVYNYGSIIDAGIAEGWTNLQQSAYGTFDSVTNVASRGVTNAYFWAGSMKGLSECISIESSNAFSGVFEAGRLESPHAGFILYHGNHEAVMNSTDIKTLEPDPNFMTKADPRRCVYLYGGNGNSISFTANNCTFRSVGTSNDPCFWVGTSKTNCIVLNGCSLANSGATNRIVLNNPGNGTGIFLSGTEMDGSDVWPGVALEDLKRTWIYRASSPLTQKSLAPNVKEIGGTSTQTNSLIRNVGGVTYIFWSNGTTVWSNALYKP